MPRSGSVAVGTGNRRGVIENEVIEELSQWHISYAQVHCRGGLYGNCFYLRIGHYDPLSAHLSDQNGAANSRRDEQVRALVGIDNGLQTRIFYLRPTATEPERGTAIRRTYCLNSSGLKHQSRLGEHIFKQNVEKEASNAEDWLAALFSYKNDGEK